MLTILTGDLPSTATYSARSWAWVSNGSGYVTVSRVMPDGEEIDEDIPAMGKLTIKQQFRQRRYIPVAWNYSDEAFGQPTYKALKPMAYEVDVYAVAEAAPQLPGSRAFLMLNISDPSQREPYLVHVGERTEACSCKAGLCKVELCKHRDSLEALLAEGVLDVADADLELVPF